MLRRAGLKSPSGALARDPRVGNNQQVSSRTPATVPHPLRSRAGLGPLEVRLLDLLWSRADAATVGDLQQACPALAYTTIMTTLDRLYRKRLLLRHRDGRAFAYRPRCSRDELLSELVSGQVTRLLGASAESHVVLSTLVRAVRDADAALLDELEALVQAERARLRGRGP
jgi:predicted transcriptional regulator